KMVGQKRAREIFFLGRDISAQRAYEMGMVNAAVPHTELESTAWQWAQEILAKSPTAIKMLKFAFNLTDDGLVGQQVFAGEATRLAYMTDEAKEGRTAFLEKRKPDYSGVKWIPLRPRVPCRISLPITRPVQFFAVCLHEHSDGQATRPPYQVPPVDLRRG
ncbi:MAG TPA: enoyl-CoA hydratase-related protein, partial [Flavobacteriales bacterium]|nr:enoyl-CoA hydratase-related protein [Flavobacteriales bacterium]